MPARRVIIVGAGPAGAALAYLLARRGVEVTLLERHHDFERAFRGEGLQPSGIDAFQQMGLGEQLMQLPRATVKTIELYQGGRQRTVIRTDRFGVSGYFISQPAMLEMLTGEAKKYPSFQLALGRAARDLVWTGNRVVGVRGDGSSGSREYQADLVVGTDGRHSTTRKHGRFTELLAPQSFDVLYFKVPFPDFWTDRTTMRLEFGPACIAAAIPASDGQLIIAFTINKGQYKELRAAGAGEWTEELLRRISVDLSTYLRAQPEALQSAVLLDVIVGRLTTWTAPGLLLLGDAAHPMSPIGGQGINLALRDALVAANHLCPVLVGGGDQAAIDAAAQRVAGERMPEIVAIQEHQQKQAQTFLRSDRLVSRLAMRLLPFLVRTGLVNLLLGKRLRAFQHGLVPVRLTA